MTETYNTRVSLRIESPREAVYAALIDPDAVAAWLHPPGMTCKVHEFDAREGGRFRMSLTYEDPEYSEAGKSGGATDSFAGRFLHLVPNERVVQAIEFESPDGAYGGEMRITVTLAEAGSGTDVTWLHENVPGDIPADQNEQGTRETLDNLARWCEVG